MLDLLIVTSAGLTLTSAAEMLSESGWYVRAVHVSRIVVSPGDSPDADYVAIEDATDGALEVGHDQWHEAVAHLDRPHCLYLNYRDRNLLCRILQVFLTREDVVIEEYSARRASEWFHGNCGDAPATR